MKKDSWKAVCLALAESHGYTREGVKRWNVSGGGLTALILRARALRSQERRRKKP